ncbi:hypothetical protein Scep_018121 [Stephania cephalantha]|uniref:SWIM-type domain-containing protein n=1 Tax=Stephania cephalantha TaxID=152367 RepID=A0AAP0IQT2_9MAGN
MGDRFVTVVCYINGKIVNGPQGVSYDIPPASYARVRVGVNRDELESVICKTLKINRNKAKVNMIYRCPMLLGSGTFNYILLPIEDEQNLKDVFDIVSEFPPPNTMELILKVITEEALAQHLRNSPTVHDEIVNATEPSVEEACHIAHRSLQSPIEYNASGDDANIGNYEHSNDEDDYVDNNEKDVSSDKDGGSHELKDEVARDALIHVVNNGSIHTSALREDGGLPDMLDKELDGMDTTPHDDALIRNVPSPVFTKLSSQAVMPIPEDSSMPPIGVWGKSKELCKGLKFDSKQDLQYAVKQYSISRHQEYVVTESERALWVVRCKRSNEGCQWRLRACKRKKNQLFEITQYDGPHTCVSSGTLQDHSQLDSNIIAQEIYGVVEQDPSTSISTLHQLIKDKFGYEVHYKKVYVARSKAIARLFGDWDASYKMLPKCLGVIEQKNPGTQVVWDYHSSKDGGAVFQRVFWSFGPSIEGFKHCRPVIQIDDAFLYGKYGGKLLIANSIDANSFIFPLAFALVGEESTEGWCWFLRCLRERVTDRDGICIISNFQESLLSAMTSSDNGWAEPRAYHRFCLRHVCDSFDEKYQDKVLKDLLYRAGTQHQLRKFEACMKELALFCGTCVGFLDDMAKEKWAMAYDRGVRYGWMTTNLAEYVNGFLKGARFYPVTALVKLTFYRCITYFNDRRAEIFSAHRKGEVFTTYAIEKVKRWATKVGGQIVVSVDERNELFEVTTGHYGLHMEKGGNKHIVSLKERHCSCNKWQCFGIPCSHLQAVCAHAQIDCWQFIEHYYRLDVYALCYKSEFNPIPDEDNWPLSSLPSLLPNQNLKRKIGRPKFTHIQNETDMREPSGKTRCGLCKKEGHNRRKCPCLSKGDAR